MKKIILVFLVFPFANIYSQQWEIMNIRDSDNTEYSYKSKSSNTAWVKTVQDKIEYFKNGKSAYTKGHEIVLYKFDCEEKKMGIMQVTVYDTNNNPLEIVDLGENRKMQYVIPDSIGESLLLHFCLKAD